MAGTRNLVAILGFLFSACLSVSECLPWNVWLFQRKSYTKHGFKSLSFAIIRFKINLHKQILVLTHQLRVLASSWCSVLPGSQGKSPTCYLEVKDFKVQIPLGSNSSWCWCIRETLQLVLLTPTQRFFWHVGCKRSDFTGLARRGCLEISLVITADESILHVCTQCLISRNWAESLVGVTAVLAECYYSELGSREHNPIHSMFL